MSQPPGFVATDKSLVCKLNKAIYGLKQAPRAWFERLTKALLTLGFQGSKCDPSLFFYKKVDVQIYVLIYVDDIIITGTSLSLIQSLIEKLHAEFALKQLGELDYFLGIQVKRLPSGSLLLTQTKYISDLIEKAGMTNCKPIATPMASSCRLSKNSGDPMTDPHLYRSIVGALQYATITRPEIGFSVNKVSQFMQQPTTDHWQSVKRILRYLQGTKQHGLFLQPCASSQPFVLRAFCDADWATDSDDRRSTSGSCVYLGPNLISWWSKKQQLVARSSAEAEYRSLALTAAELLWLQSLFSELQLPFKAPVVYCDNLSAVALSHNPVLHSRTKHMELDLYFVREKVLNKSLSVVHVPALDQVADILTKPLSQSRFCTIRDKLRVLAPQPTLA